MQYQLSLLAERDLVGIAQSTRERWGDEQARRYGQLLEDTLQQLLTNPLIGRTRPELYTEARSFPAGSHIVFYRATPFGIEVARVLHKHMDIEKQF
ncbi:MAG TPA: type II toxin-antitoxin system RelE/ParE family toxin [Pseudomonadales bacterium]|nr:type II toxin-antitoxin system RelE/ParE family toxin [Pseudomonadales bacterium]